MLLVLVVLFFIIVLLGAAAFDRFCVAVLSMVGADHVVIVISVVAAANGRRPGLLGASDFKGEFANLDVDEVLVLVLFAMVALLPDHSTRESTFRIHPDKLDVGSNRLLCDNLLIVNVDDEGRSGALAVLEVFGVLNTRLANSVPFRVRVVDLEFDLVVFECALEFDIVDDDALNLVLVVVVLVVIVVRIEASRH
ncbi:hypothetical protein IWX49DRAFT_564053 [Phyllosticta citricarpa]